jgi:hypothetical protein
MSIRSYTNTEGANVGKISGRYLAVDAGDNITLEITPNGSLKINSEGGGGGINSVNGFTGPEVELITENIPETIDKYYMTPTDTTNINNLLIDVGTLQTDVGTLQTDVGTLQTDVGTLQTDVGTLQTDVFALQTDVLDIETQINKINVPDGYCVLDSAGKVLAENLPNSIMEYKGEYNIEFNVPDLQDGVGNAGDVYLSNAEGTRDFGTLLNPNIISLVVGDYILYSGSIWQKSSSVSYTRGEADALFVFKAGDTMTGQLNAPSVKVDDVIATNLKTNVDDSTNFSLLLHQTQYNKDIDMNGHDIVNLDVLNANISKTENLEVNVNALFDGQVQISPFVSTGIVKNNSSGVLSHGLISNSDIINNAQIEDTKLATISTAGKVSNCATSATTEALANTIVLRDGSGNIPNVVSSVNSQTGPNVVLDADDINETATRVYVSPAQKALLQNATSTATPDTLVLRNGDGTIIGENLVVVSTSELQGDVNIGGTINATGQIQYIENLYAGTLVDTALITTTNATISSLNTAGVVKNNASGVLSTGKITNTDIDASAGIEDSKLATISTAGKVSNSATTATTSATPNTIVLRDSSGNIPGGGGGAVDSVNGQTGVVVLDADDLDETATRVYVSPAQKALLQNATSANTADTLVLRNVNGGFSAGAITNRGLIVNGTLTPSSQPSNQAEIYWESGILRNTCQTFEIATQAFGTPVTRFSISTTGVIRFPNNNNPLANRALICDGSSTLTSQAYTSNASASSFAFRDESGNCNFNNITLTSLNTEGIVKNNASGVLSTGKITNTDVDASAGIVDTKLATISTAGKVANSATTATTLATPNTIVLRDGSGNIPGAGGAPTERYFFRLGNNVNTMATGVTGVPVGGASPPPGMGAWYTNSGAGTINLTTGVFTAATKGVYSVSVFAQWGPSGVGVRNVRIFATNIIAKSNYTKPEPDLSWGITSNGIVAVQAGETITVDLFQNSGSSLVVFADVQIILEQIIP